MGKQRERPRLSSVWFCSKIVTKLVTRLVTKLVTILVTNLVTIAHCPHARPAEP